MKRVVFLLASWVIYSDNYYGSKEFNIPSLMVV